MRENARTMLHAAALGVGSRVVEPPQPREGNRAGAHRAGLKRDVEIRAADPLGAERRAGLPDRDDLGMGRGIAELARAVAAAPDHPAVENHGSADRHLAARARRDSFREGDVEPGFSNGFRGIVRRHACHPLANIVRRGLASAAPSC